MPEWLVKKLLDGHRAPMRPAEQPVLFEFGQVAPDGGSRDRQALRQFIDHHFSVAAQLTQDLLLAHDRN